MQIPAILGAVQPAKAQSSHKIADAAKQFEAILLNQILQTAQTPADDSDNEESSIGDFSRQQFAQALADRGGLGIAKMVLAGLAKNAD